MQDYIHICWSTQSKETVSSHKNLGVSEPKTTSEMYLCVCTYVRMSGKQRSGTGRQRMEGASSKQNGLSVLLNWNWSGNC